MTQSARRRTKIPDRNIANCWYKREEQLPDLKQDGAAMKNPFPFPFPFVHRTSKDGYRRYAMSWSLLRRTSLVAGPYEISTGRGAGRGRGWTTTVRTGAFLYVEEERDDEEEEVPE
jgi:hypothetical protein